MLKRAPRSLIVVICLLVFGLVRSPVEDRMRAGLEENRMLRELPGQGGMQAMGQSVLMGTLGGLRSLVASYLVIESYFHFSNQAWDENRRALIMATYLEPAEENHWVDLVWHRGINATAWVEVHSELPALERDLRYNEYVLDAIELARAGLEQLPDSIEIRKQLAEVYDGKLKDPCGTAEVYGEMIGLEGAPQFAERFYGYFLADCPGREREAYEHLIELYWEGEHHHLPTLIKKIRDLQQQLNVPSPLWISDPDPDEERRRQAETRRVRPVLPGGIRLP